MQNGICFKNDVLLTDTPHRPWLVEKNTNHTHNKMMMRNYSSNFAFGRHCLPPHELQARVSTKRDKLGRAGDGKYGHYTSGTSNDPFLRAGICYFGYKNCKLGWNSEGIRHAVQNVALHDNFLDWFGKPSPWFENLHTGGSPYFGINSINPYSIWGHY